MLFLSYDFFGNLVSMALREPYPVSICILNCFTLPPNAKGPAVEDQPLHISANPGQPEQENTGPHTFNWLLLLLSITHLSCLTCPAPQEGYEYAYKINILFLLCAQHNLDIWGH